MVVGNKYELPFSPLYLRHPLDILRWIKRSLRSLKSKASLNAFISSNKFKGEQLQDKRLSAIIFFGKGLLAGILFRDPKRGEPDGLFASRVCEKAMQKGLLLVHTGRESIKIGPSLTIPDEALAEGIDVLKESIEELN